MGQIAGSLERGAHLVGAYLEASVGELRLTQGEAHVLAQLDRAGTMPIAALHREFGHKRSTLTNILDRLEKRRLIRRELNPGDRRSFLVRLTPVGHRMARKISAALQRLEHELGSQVERNDPTGLERIVAALDSLVHRR